MLCKIKFSSKGRWVLNGYFFQGAHFSSDIQHAIRTRWVEISNQDHSQLWSPYGFLINNIKVKILVIIKWSCGSSQSYWLLNLECFSYFEHAVQSLLNTCLFGDLFLESHQTHTPLNYRCPFKISNRIRHAYLIDMLSCYHANSWTCSQVTIVSRKLRTSATSAHLQVRDGLLNMLSRLHFLT